MSRTLVLVGSWTGADGPPSDPGGVTVLDLLPDGSLTRLGVAGADLHAGYLALSPDQRSLYCVDERRDSERLGHTGGAVAAFAVDAGSGGLSQLGAVPTYGALPCQLTVAPQGDLVAVANHGSYEYAVRTRQGDDGPRAERVFDSGTVTLLPVTGAGDLGPPLDTVVLEGRPDGWRAEVLTDPSGQWTFEFQASAHPHAAVFDPAGELVAVCDKGTDRVVVLEVAEGRSRLAPLASLDAEPGTGPRHARFHPAQPLLYVLHELRPTLSVLRVDRAAGHLVEVQRLSTLPEGCETYTWPAELLLHPSGRFVYATNRGHDSVVALRVRPDGTLGDPSWTPTGGRTPRSAGVDPSGRWLVVLNQDSGTVVTFGVDQDTGALTATGAVLEVDRPVSVAIARYDAGG